MNSTGACTCFLSSIFPRQGLNHAPLASEDACQVSLKSIQKSQRSQIANQMPGQPLLAGMVPKHILGRWFKRTVLASCQVSLKSMQGLHFLSQSIRYQCGHVITPTILVKHDQILSYQDSLKSMQWLCQPIRCHGRQFC